VPCMYLATEVWPISMAKLEELTVDPGSAQRDWQGSCHGSWRISSHPAAERIKCGSGDCRFRGVVLGAVITAGIAAGRIIGLSQICVWTMRPWNNDGDYAASE